MKIEETQRDSSILRDDNKIEYSTKGTGLTAPGHLDNGKLKIERYINEELECMPFIEVNQMKKTVLKNKLNKKE